MLYGLYLSAHGAENQTLRMETIANNLANVGSTGFKRDLVVFQEANPFDIDEGIGHRGPEELRDMSGGGTVAETYIDMSGGPLLQTGGELDLAIAGRGFATVSHNGETRLTRDLQLALNDEGTLVNQSGMELLTPDGGPIRLPPGLTDVLISHDGLVSGRDAAGVVAAYGQIGMTDVLDPRQLKKVGQNLYAVEGETIPVDSRTQLKQGFVEGSAVIPVQEMLEMIKTSRAVEANINMIKFQDETLSQLLDTLPGR